MFDGKLSGIQPHIIKCYFTVQFDTQDTVKFSYQLVAVSARRSSAAALTALASLRKSAILHEHEEQVN